MYELEDIVKNTEHDFSGNIEIDSSLYAQYYKLSTLYYEKNKIMTTFIITLFNI